MNRLHADRKTDGTGASRPSLLGAAFIVAVVATVVPLWSAHYLPMVDLPEHLHLIDVLGRLHDADTLYPQVFDRRYELTPYLSYYYTVWLLSHVVDLFTANAIFLTLVAVATPVSVGILARRLGGSFWIGILACPLFYGDNLYWGFINYSTSLPLALLTIAACLSILDEPPHPRYLREIGLALLLIAVQLTHEMAFCFLGIALPVLMLFSPSDRRRRMRAVAAVLPAVAIWAVWWLGRFHTRPASGGEAPWKGWTATFVWKAFGYVHTPLENLGRLGELLANGFRDEGDRPAVLMLALIAAASLVLAIVFRNKQPRSWRMIARGPLLAAIALALYLFLPYHVHGFVAIVNTRFAALFALLAVAALPFPSRPWAQRTIVFAALAMCVWYGGVLTTRFRRFDQEARAIDAIIAATGPKPKIMAILYDNQGGVSSHFAYQHFTCYAALARGGITSNSFAVAPLAPVCYTIAKPPAFFEFCPEHFDYKVYGHYYDHFLVRGEASAATIFRGFEDEVREAARSGAFTLYARRPAQIPATDAPR